MLYNELFQAPHQSTAMRFRRLCTTSLDLSATAFAKPHPRQLSARQTLNSLSLRPNCAKAQSVHTRMSMTLCLYFIDLVYFIYIYFSRMCIACQSVINQRVARRFATNQQLPSSFVSSVRSRLSQGCCRLIPLENTPFAWTQLDASRENQIHKRPGGHLSSIWECFADASWTQ